MFVTELELNEQGVANQTVAAGEAMPPLVLPVGSGGDGTLTYSLSPGRCQRV